MIFYAIHYIETCWLFPFFHVTKVPILTHETLIIEFFHDSIQQIELIQLKL